MRFQTKIILGYAIFVLGVAFLLGFGYYRFSLDQFQKNEENNMRVISQQITSQMDEMFKMMEHTTHYILSDSRVLSAIRIMAEADHLEIEDRYLKDAVTDIQSGIRTDYIVNNFHRTIVFNRTFSAVASTNILSKENLDPEKMNQMIWLKRADEQMGRPVIAGTHEDTWGIENPQVFSLVKAVQGNNMGYIEVQRKAVDIEKLVQLPKEGLEYAIIVNENELLYANFEVEDLEELFTIAKEKGEFVNHTSFLDDGSGRLVAKTDSKQYKISVLLMENMDTMRQNGSITASMTFVIAGIFFSISMVFVILISRILTKPIRDLRKVMEATKIENMGDNMILQSSIDEIEALNVSYQNVLDRLKTSMLKEKKMALLQLQAQFDTLQSQVNPHFLFNVLNIIAARGMSNNDETICNMCACLASMLRYSTNTRTRYASVSEELGYLEQYFYLQKARYEHKIEFKIQVSKEILQETIPKMTLQQIVENCINHAFENSVGQMQITITGWREADKWYCRVTDNGDGIGKETLMQLEQKFDQTKNRILKFGENIELEIGGMGLVNTYARLLLLYNEDLEFYLKSFPFGTEVTVGAPMRKGADSCFGY